MKLDASAERRVLKQVEKGVREELSFLKELIHVKSFPGTKEEGEAQKLIEQKLMEVGDINIDVWEPKLEDVNKYPFHPIREERDHWNYRGRPNIVGVIDGETNNSLILNGHIDVVSPEPLAAWTKSPWDGETEGGKVYGRGANDMKAGLASILFAVRAVIESGFRPRGRVIVESVVEEEFGGGGSIAALLRGYTASAVLIAEPSGSKNLCIGSGGSRFFRVEIMGKSETPQAYHHGVNAIDPAYKIYRALTSLNEARQKRLRGKHPNYEKGGEGALFGDGKVTNLVVGKFRAGDFPATVAGRAEMEGRVGFPAGERGRDVCSELERAVMEEARKDKWMKEKPPVVKWFNAQREPYELSRTEPLVNEARRCVKDVVRVEPTLFATPASADCVFFANRVGRLGGLPTVMYGPGGENTHAADEFVYHDDLIEATKVIALLVMRWCGYTKAG